MTAFYDSAPVEQQAPSTDYVGRVFFYVKDPAAVLANGHDRIAVKRRNTPLDPWVEWTNKSTELIVEPGKHNYVLVDGKAKRTMQYCPVLRDSSGATPDVEQLASVQDAVDAAYEAVLTPAEMKDRYFYGLLDLFQDAAGAPFPDRLYVHYIQYGIRKFETKARIKVLPTPVVGEAHDYDPADWRGKYGMLLLDEFPCVRVDSVKFRLPGCQEFAVPASWLRTDLAAGQVHVVPDGTGSAPLMGAGLAHVPFARHVPQAIAVDYVAGFPLGHIPENIKDMIGKEAASGPLNLAGDLVGGAAIASQSLSVDGLSQSVNTTSSATNAGFGARLIQYNNELKRDYPVVQAYYKGVRLYCA